MATHKVDLSSLRIDQSKREQTADGRKGGGRYLWIVALILLIVIAISAWRLLTPVQEVRLATATMQSSSQADAVLTASGYIVAQRKAAVASKGTGRLAELNVVEGDRVRSQQIIARLEDNDIRAQLSEARANLRLRQAELDIAEKTYGRQKSLIAAGAVPQATYDAAESEYQRAQAAVELARAQVQAAEVALENMLIRAPFDGTVLTKNADVGEIVAPLAAGVNSRAAVVTVADMSSLQVEADVSESNIEKIRPAMECEITLDAYPDQRYPGYVAKIVPTADRAKATVLVKVAFKEYDARVLPEMSAKVLFLRGDLQPTNAEPPMLVVPRSALVARGGRDVVFQVRDNAAVSVPVTAGRSFGAFVEIKSGLAAGDRVIEQVSDKITEGAKVTVK